MLTFCSSETAESSPNPIDGACKKGGMIQDVIEWARLFSHELARTLSVPLQVTVVCYACLLLCEFMTWELLMPGRCEGRMAGHAGRASCSPCTLTRIVNRKHKSNQDQQSQAPDTHEQTMTISFSSIYLLLVHSSPSGPGYISHQPQLWLPLPWAHWTFPSLPNTH